MNIKKTKLKNRHNFNIDNEDFEIVEDFVYLSLVINSNEDCSQEIKRKRRLRVGRA